MSTGASFPLYASGTMHEPDRRATVPWYIWTGVIAVTSSTIGGAWDVSWHRSIGRDTFWTPAHLMIQACGVLAAVIGLYLVLTATFGKSQKALELRAASVNIFGLYAPLGVFLAAWGGIAMLTSAPFDNWWHNAYGLDVKIVSPPHALLVLGIRGVGFGVLFLILAAMNRAQAVGDSSYRRLQQLLLYIGGLSMGGNMFFIQEYTWDVVLHQTSAYIALAIAVPVIFAMYSQASRFRWAATTTAAVYTFCVIAEILILPLFPATPKLGPVFNPVTHLVPAKFPVLILVPAILLDLFWERVKNWKLWQIAIVSGVIFVAILTPVEWEFAKFLMSKASENRFFGTMYFDYNAPPPPFGIDRARIFWHPAYGWPLVEGLTIATFCAMLSSWLGLAFGRWMRGVQR
jgi:hypothetical protein